MAEQTTMDAPATKRAMEDQTYTVQRLRQLAEVRVVEEEENLPPVVGDTYNAWVDVATVTVPARTLRKTVVEKALSEAGITPEVGGQMHVRVLDAQSASPFTVGAEQPAPVLVIGEPS